MNLRRFLHASGPAALVVMALALLACPAEAARLHVLVGGELAAGPSTPDDWTPANCYPTLTLALAQAAPQDTVLVSREVHFVDAPLTLTALLGNPELDEAAESARLVLEAAGGLVIGAGPADCEIRGVTLDTADDALRSTAAISVTPGGAVPAILLQGCAVIDMRRTSVAGDGGAALSLPGPGEGASVTLRNCAFLRNETVGPGGALYVGGGYDVVAEACRFEHNEAQGPWYGGAMSVRAAGAATTLSFQDSRFAHNLSAGPGGAMDVRDASLHLLGCEVIGSRTAHAEDAIFAEGAGVRWLRTANGHDGDAELLVENCRFYGNKGDLDNDTSAGNGGGLYVAGTADHPVAFAVHESSFIANYNAQGGGIYAGDFAEGEITYCRFLENGAWYQGGAVMKAGEEANYGESVALVYCEFQENVAGYSLEGASTGEYSRGGAVMVRNQASAVLENCTFLDNTVNDAGYAIGDAFAHALEAGEWGDENLVSLTNCVFWGQGQDVQARSEAGGVGVATHLAAAAGQLALAMEPTESVTLTAYPFLNTDDLRPLEESGLIDAGLDLGYDHDLNGMTVPAGLAPDIGAFESHGVIGVDDVPSAGSATLTAAPNPFNPRTTLLARVATAGPASVVIFDARGRCVRELVRGELSAGEHELRWDGRDDGGREVAAGTYLARLDAAGGTPAVTKLVLVR